jgi:hypothetical protein
VVGFSWPVVAHQKDPALLICPDRGLVVSIVTARGVVVVRGLTGAVGVQGRSSTMNEIWDAAAEGDVGEVERWLGQDPDLLDATIGDGFTPLMCASLKGHVEVVRCLLDHGAAINLRDDDSQCTALYIACFEGRLPVVRLLVERGADPTLARADGWTPLIIASIQGHLEVVRSLLGHPRAKETINHREEDGRTALWSACFYGRGGVVSALLESGADPTVSVQGVVTPMTVAKHEGELPEGVTAEGRRECVAALEVSLCRPLPSASILMSSLAEAWGVWLGRGGRMRSGPTCCGRPGRWRMRLGASRRRRCRRGGRGARSSVGAWRQCRRS